MNNEFSREDKKLLLTVARESIVTAFTKETPSTYEKLKKEGKFSEKSGVFVTLYRDDKLRGCIGTVAAMQSLIDNVFEYARHAAFDDPRFPPLNEVEIKDLNIEVSVLTPPRRVDSYEEIEIGKHGIILEKNYNSALFLPQVAPEQGWDLEMTLTQLSIKAGLPPYAWKEPDTKFYVFEAIYFDEKEILKE